MPGSPTVARGKNKDFKIIEGNEIMTMESIVTTLLEDGYEITNAMSVYDTGKKYHVVYLVR